MSSREPELSNVSEDALFKKKQYDSFWQACCCLDPDMLFFLARILCNDAANEEYSRLTGSSIEQDRYSAAYIADLAFSFADANTREVIRRFATDEELDGRGQCKSFHDLGIPLFLPGEHSANTNAKLLYEQCKKDNGSEKKPHFQPVLQNIKSETQSSIPSQSNASPISELTSESKGDKNEDAYIGAETGDRLDEAQYSRAPEGQSLSAQTWFNFLDKAQEFVKDNPRAFICLGLVVAVGLIPVAISFWPIIAPLAILGGCLLFTGGSKLYKQCFWGKTGHEKDEGYGFSSSDSYGSSRYFGYD